MLKAYILLFVQAMFRIAATYFRFPDFYLLEKTGLYTEKDNSENLVGYVNAWSMPNRGMQKVFLKLV